MGHFWLSMFIVLAASNKLFAQNWFVPKDSSFTFFRPSAMLQLWGIYSINEKQDLDGNGEPENLDDRFDVFLRRARLGFSGQPYSKVCYTVVLFYDNLGKDVFTAHKGGGNDGSTFGIWDAFLTYRFSNNEGLNLVAGYFRPQFGRENITSAWSVNSLEKSFSQTYSRLHLTGKNNGRATGLNLGGLFKNTGWSFYYNLGIFDNVSFTSYQNTTGIGWSPLLTARTVFTLGDPEINKYQISYLINYFSERKGISLGLQYGSQGETDIFQNSRAYGFDILLNYGRWNFDGEWVYLERETSQDEIASGITSHIRLGYNIILNQKYFIEPVFMLMNFNGEEDFTYSGKEIQQDYGINWYLDKRNLRLGIHYSRQKGSGKNFYTLNNGNSGMVGEKGDYLGLGMNMIIN
jgi:hypothetical protein